MANTRGRQSAVEKAAVPALVHAGPALARVGPVRPAVVGLIGGC